MMEVVVTTAAISHAELLSNHHHQQTNIQFFYRGTGIRGLMRGMATLPQGNQRAVSGQRQSWKTPI